MPKKAYTAASKNKKKPSYDFKQAPLVERLKIKMSHNDEHDLNAWLDREIENINQARNGFAQRQERYLYNWDDFVTNTRKGPWDGSSNLHLPLTAIMVKSTHARLYSIFTHEQTTQLSPRETTDDKFTALISKLRFWYLWDYINGYRGIKGFAREVFYDTCTIGFGIGIKDWQIQQRKVLLIEENQMEELQREVADLEPQMQELAAGKQELETDEEMAEKRLSISPYKEVQKIITVFEGSRLRSVPWENVYFPNDIPESNDLDYPCCVMVESEMTTSAITMKGAQGLWDQSGVENVIAEKSSAFANPSAERIKQQRGRMTGYNKATEVEDYKRVIQSFFCSYDIDGDGIDEEIIVTRSDKKTILDINYLDRISPTGQRPLFKFDCFSKSRQGYSRGVPEYMYPINEEIDNIHNKRQDSLTLQTTPFGCYRSSSSLRNEPIRIAPGKLLPVDETTDIRLLSWGTNATALGGEQQILWNYAERMISITALSQGAVPDTVGPTRSTSGVITLLKQMDKEFKPMVDQCADQWKKMEKMLLADLDLRISPEVKLRVLGSSVPDPSMLIKKYGQGNANAALMINSAFDIKIDVASAVNSDEVKRNDAQVLLQALSAPSIAQQMGIVGPKALYRAISDYLSAYGKNPEDYIDEPQFVAKPLTLYQEIQICGQGEMPPMSMQDDHQRKAQMLVAFTQEPEFQEAVARRIFVANAQEIVMGAAKKHMVLADMLQPQGLPNPSGANQQNMSETQAGTSPQQGGQNPNKTTSRQLSDEGTKKPENGEVANESEE